MTLAFADKVHNSKSFQQNGLRPYIERLSTYKDDGQLQVVHTPFWLCEDILGKVSEFRNLKNSNILVLFNLEFVDVLLVAFHVNPAKITFAADAETKLEAAKAMGCKTLTVNYSKEQGVAIMPDPKKKFDVVVMNPPYQAPTKNDGGGYGSRNTLWDKFVEMSLKLVKDSGYVANIHPPRWRKPLSELYHKLTFLQIEYLEMHSKSDGIKTFGASTPFDWYVLHNIPRTGKTIVVDFDGNKHQLLMTDVPFLPNCDFKAVEQLLAKDREDHCDVLFSCTEYETRKPWMQGTQNGIYKHPCVHVTPKSEPIKFWYSRRRGKFFDTPKIIFGDAQSIQKSIVDVHGEYGITQHAMALPIKSEKEGNQIKKAIESDAFNDLLQKAMRWSQFGIDWRLFTLFRKDFWKEFI